MIVPAIGDHEAVSRRIDRAQPAAGKVAGVSSRRTVVCGSAADGVTYSTCRPEQIQHIAAPQGKVAHLVVRKHGADG